jgi:uncharacterized protein DUF2510
MNEFVTVSSSSYDPASLATKLTEKSAQGWEIVAIVPTGGDVTAFLSRESTGAAADTSAMMTSEDTSTPAVAAAPEPAPAMAEAAPAEPAGWAVAPDPAPTSSAPATVIQSSSPMASMDTSSSAPNYSSAPAAPAAPAPAATPAVPAGWYADPAGRFDLRYWDGGTWTEHVSRAGQQFTDAPVA